MGIITFQTEDGPVPFEVASVRAGVGEVSSRKGAPKVSDERLEDALALVGRVATSLQRSLGNLDVAKAEATIAVKLSVEGSFVVAKSTAEASISVTVTLTKDGQ